MAEIEKGDYFVVVRGIEQKSMPHPVMFDPENHVMIGIETQSTYDRSHDGIIYYAKEVCGLNMVAAEIVGIKDLFMKRNEEVGKVISLNISELEVWPITEQYLIALGIELITKEQRKE